MMRRMFLGKIHRARITHADLHYEGSVTIDRDLMDAAGMLEHEEVHVWNVTQGTRLVTYTLSGPHGSGVICLNGAAAHGNKPGDIVILSIFGDMPEAEARTWQPKVVLCDDDNRIKSLGAERPGPAMPRHLSELGA